MEIKEGSKVRIKNPEFSHKEWEVKAIGMNLPGGSFCIQKGSNIQMVSLDEIEIAEEQTIEVGDVIKVKQHPCIGPNMLCDVVGEDADAFVLRPHATYNSWKDVDTRTLIRKGQKVHVFEGVTWYAAGDTTGSFTNNDSKGKNAYRVIVEPMEKESRGWQ